MLAVVAAAYSLDLLTLFTPPITNRVYDGKILNPNRRTTKFLLWFLNLFRRFETGYKC